MLTDHTPGHGYRAKAYRPDIDGLRAIAVLAVIIYHFNAAWLPGGFVGVDVFFVISGYLITGLLLKDMEQGTFTLTEFYRRRVKRIGPAMLAVIAATLIAAQFILHPADLEELSKATLAALLFVPNLYATFELDTGYFAQATEVEPLLHLWSLGVEEQFYLFWPLALMALAAIRLKPLFWAALAVIGIGGSTWLAEVILPTQPEFAYYMLPTRAGQLLMGALCAYWAFTGSRWLQQKWVPFLAIPGLALIFGSYVGLTAEGGYPGVNSVPVTAGAAMVILAGIHRQGWVSKLIGIKPLVLIGLVSYSLYLWHWPVLALARYREQSLTPGLMLGLALFIALISWASYRFIEQPFRRSAEPFRPLVLRQWVLPSAGLFAIGLFFYSTSGLGLYLFNADFRHQYEMVGGGQEPASRADYVCQHGTVTQVEMTAPECIVNSTNEPDVLLWGDSNAGHYVGAFKVLGEFMGFGFRNIVHSACPPLINNAEQYTSEKWKERCAESSKRVAGNLESYDSVILAASWDTAIKYGPDLSAELANTVSALVNSGKNVYVVGRTPRLDGNYQTCRIKQLKGVECELDGLIRIKQAEKINEVVRQVAEQNGATYLDFNSAFCLTESCGPYIENEFVYFDGGHISLTGSEVLGMAAAQSEQVREALSKLAVEPGVATENEITWKVDHVIDYMPTSEFGDYFDKHRHLYVEDQDTSGYSTVIIPLNELLPQFRVPDGAGLAFRFTIKAGEGHPLFRLYLNRGQDSEARYDFVYDAKRGALTAPAGSKIRIRRLEDLQEVTFVTPTVEATDAVDLRIYGGASTGEGYSSSATGLVAINNIALGIFQPSREAHANR